MELRVYCRSCLNHFNIQHLVDEDPTVKKLHDKERDEHRLRFTCPICDSSQENVIWSR